MNTLEVECVEVCAGDRLRGYAVFFSGGYDAYLVDGLMGHLLCVGRNFMSREGALRAVREGADWRKRDKS